MLVALVLGGGAFDVMVFGGGLAGMAAARAAVTPVATCHAAKARAAGKAAFGLLRALGKNGKASDLGRLSADVSKTRSKLSKQFTSAESGGACATSDDVAVLEAKIDLFVEDVRGEVVQDPPTTTTTTTGATTTTTTVATPCDFTAPPTCGGTCPAGLACGNVGLGECRCLGPGTPCGDALFPSCGGVCPTPIGGFCLPSVGSECACQ